MTKDMKDNIIIYYNISSLSDIITRSKSKVIKDKIANLSALINESSLLFARAFFASVPDSWISWEK